MDVVDVDVDVDLDAIVSELVDIVNWNKEVNKKKELSVRIKKVLSLVVEIRFWEVWYEVEDNGILIGDTGTLVEIFKIIDFNNFD